MQAPQNQKARLYRVLKEVAENRDVGEGARNSVACPIAFVFACVRGASQVSHSGRVKDKEGKDHLKRQMQGMAAPEMLNLENGQIKTKRVKKEKTPQQSAMEEMKKLQKKRLGKQTATSATRAQVEGPCAWSPASG